MLSSITPLGERGRGNRYWLTVTTFIVASTLGGALTGALLGLLGWPLKQLIDRIADGNTTTATTITAVLALVLAAVALVFDAGVKKLRLPRWLRQVNEDWMTMYRGWVYGAGFGFQLGMGLVTIVTAGTVYLLFALCLLSGSPAVGALLAGTFGLTRGLAVLPAWRIHSTEDLVSFHQAMAKRQPWSHTATVVADAVVLASAALVIIR